MKYILNTIVFSLSLTVLAHAHNDHKNEEKRQIWLDDVNALFFSNQANDFTQKNDEEVLRLVIKQMGYKIAKEKFDNRAKVDFKIEPTKVNLTSKLCVEADIDSYWYQYWCHRLKLAPIYHRKPWEFAYIAQVAHENDILKPGKKAIAFGCGEEPLPALFASYGMKVLATDAPSEEVAKAWSGSGQYGSLEKLKNNEICPDEKFNELCSFEKADMNNVDPLIAKPERYDLVWSACALEHLGSIEKGLKFIEKSVELLAPGGIAVHTTEYSLNGKSMDNTGAVNFTKEHMEDVKKRLEAKGYQVSTFDYSKGTGVLDTYIDLPPYDKPVDQKFGGEAHLRLLVNDIPSTSIGMIVKKVK